MPTELNPDYGFLKQKSHLPDDLSSENVFYDTLLDKYMDRHDDLKYYLYPEWAGNYIMKNKPCRKPTADDSNSSDGDDDDHNRPVSYEDNKGRVLRKRNKFAVTRGKLYMPSGELREK